MDSDWPETPEDSQASHDLHSTSLLRCERNRGKTFLNCCTDLCKKAAITASYPSHYSTLPTCGMSAKPAYNEWDSIIIVQAPEIPRSTPDGGPSSSCTRRWLPGSSAAQGVDSGRSEGRSGHIRRGMTDLVDHIKLHMS